MKTKRFFVIHLLLGVCVLAPCLTCLGDTPTKKQAVPGVEEQARAVELVRDVFADEYAEAKTDTARSRLAQTMLKSGTETEDPLEQYVVLRVARDLAAKANNARLAEEIMDEMESRFEIDVFQMKTRTLLGMVKKAKSSIARRDIARRGAALLPQAIQSEDVPAVAGLVEAWGPTIRGAGDSKLTAQFLKISKQIEELKKEYVQVQAALAELEANPSDPEANLCVGKFRCLQKQQWADGLSYLALGSDETLKDLAVQELADPQDTGAQEKLADGWWSYSTEQSGTAASSAKSRAAYWYLKALPDLAGLSRVKAQRRTEGAPPPVAAPPVIARPDPEPKNQRFIDRGQYVEDTKTGLLWQKDGDEAGKLNFHQAAQYASNLNLGGLKGWRVPTAKELAGIFPATEKPFQDSKYVKDPQRGDPMPSYWTSELDRRADDYAFVYHWYRTGGANNCYASRNFVYVRCVHDPVKRE